LLKIGVGWAIGFAQPEKMMAGIPEKGLGYNSTAKEKY